MRRIIVIASLAFAGIVAGAPEVTERPLAAGRVVRIFDFEERDTNPNEVPHAWTRVFDAPVGRRPTLPEWNLAEIVYAEGDPTEVPPASGIGMVRLPTNGGGTRLLLDPGVLPIFSNTDYSLVARVRTEGLVNARAQVTARFLDRAGHAIPGTDRSTEPVLSERRWGEVRVSIDAAGPDAAFLQLQLDLVQPSQRDERVDGRAVPDDLRGAAYFDDLAILQLPKVDLKPKAPLGIFRVPEPAELEATVRDLTGEDLEVSVDVFDGRGVLVDRVSRPVGAGMKAVHWRPRIPALGWYRAVMTLRAGPRLVGGDSCDFILIASEGPASGGADGVESAALADRSRFGIILGDLPPALITELPELSARFGAGSITIPMVPGEAVPALVERLLQAHEAVSLAFPRIPDAVAQRTGSNPLDVWAYALADPRAFMELADPWIDRFGDRVSRWQFGRVGDDRIYWRDGVEPELEKVGGTFRRLAPGVSIVIPRLVDQTPLPAPGYVEQVAFVPGSVPASAMYEHGQALAAARGVQVVAFGRVAPGEVSPWDAGSELAKRAVQAWAGAGVQPPALALVDPWAVEGDRPSPGPELAAWRSVATHLAGRRVAARIPSPEGTTCYLLAPSTPGEQRSGAIVAWNDWAEERDAVINAYLGAEALTAFDVYGNRQAVPKSSTASNGRALGVRIPLSSSPVFVEGVDAELVLFLASLAITPDFIESTGEHHELAIALKNTYASGVSGSLTVVEPARRSGGNHSVDDWRISPRQLKFSIPAGGQASLPISAALPSRIESGGEDFVFELNISGRSGYPPIEVRRRVTIGLHDVHVDLRARVQGNDVIVEASIANRGAKPLNLSLAAFLPDRPRVPGTISGLMPGAQMVRRFSYPGVASKVRGERAVLILSDPESHARLTVSAVVE